MSEHRHKLYVEGEIIAFTHLHSTGTWGERHSHSVINQPAYYLQTPTPRVAKKAAKK